MFVTLTRPALLQPCQAGVPQARALSHSKESPSTVSKGRRESRWLTSTSTQSKPPRGSLPLSLGSSTSSSNIASRPEVELGRLLAPHTRSSKWPSSNLDSRRSSSPKNTPAQPKARRTGPNLQASAVTHPLRWFSSLRVVHLTPSKTIQVGRIQRTERRMEVNECVVSPLSRSSPPNHSCHPKLAVPCCRRSLRNEEPLTRMYGCESWTT